MNLSQALKEKNRLAGELVRLQTIFSRENSRRDDNVSKVNPEEVWKKILETSDRLGALKAKIAVANIEIYPAIERMAELKSRIAYLAALSKREGPEDVVGYNTPTLHYKWTAFMNQQRCDEEIAAVQLLCNDLQDKIDSHNATHEI
jgi:hypothetical protein